MKDLQIEGELTNEYGTFDVVVNEIDTKTEQALVVLLEDTPYGEKGDSSWVDLENVET